MIIAKKILKKQQGGYFAYLWRGAAFAVIGIIGGRGILANGIGSTSNKNSAGAVIYKALDKLMAQNETMEKLVPICFSFLFFILAFMGFSWFFRGLWGIVASHTVLGKSLLSQARNHETITEMLNDIDNDFEINEPTAFGPLYIGKKWLIGDEAMRIDYIRGVFVIDSGKNNYALCIVDDHKNSQAIGLDERRYVYDAADFLYAILPNVESGGGEEYLAFTDQDGDASPYDEVKFEGGESILEFKIMPRFKFIQPSGIPTSNFKWEDIEASLKTLSEEEKVGLSLFEPMEIADYVEVEEIFCGKDSKNLWEISISYEKKDKPYTAFKAMSEYDAWDCMKNLLGRGSLPNFSLWEQIQHQKQK